MNPHRLRAFSRYKVAYLWLVAKRNGCPRDIRLLLVNSIKDELPLDYSYDMWLHEFELAQRVPQFAPYHGLGRNIFRNGPFLLHIFTTADLKKRRFVCFLDDHPNG
jgi:hypothetical protein